ncbi:GDSL-type esterase/lipase family protein [Halioxenophilus sp. WMMB6]|uniref:GDSL-type esterase/lipase family protein n=1 Tax=Halioxenophilus sp. WMMB6 TaxID=3073815 RepID=UPI00295EF6D5|nr:GDSL-type esterase/lipase family protein [Halioxenophilus sp. WMMB6]
MTIKLSPRLVLLLLALLLLLLGLSQFAPKATLSFVGQPSQTFSRHYLARKALFDQAREQSTVAFVGDSLTEGMPWQQILPNTTTANRGINGDTLPGLQNRLDSVFATEARCVLVMMGINDLMQGESVKQTLASYRDVISTLARRHPRIVIQSTLLTTNDQLNQLVVELNEGLRQLASEFSNVEFIDLNTTLGENHRLRTSYTMDGVHLTNEGYSVWQQQIEPVITLALSTP